MRRIAIIGFGFSGCMVTANLVHKTVAPCEIYLIDPTLNARGMAYGTPYDAHLLNVRAANMSAWPEAPQDFVAWLTTNKKPYGPQDFVPRRIYGDYLESIWQKTQELAAEKKLVLKLVPSRAVALSKHDDHLAVLTERGDAIAADKVVLATGNEVKPISTAIERVLQAPWMQGALAQAAKEQGPILLIGTGLTAVDAVLALRAEGYKQGILAYSRNGLLPQAHAEAAPALTLSASELAGLHTMRQWARWFRQRTRQSDWRAVVDGLRPFTQTVWQKLRSRQQRIFFRRLFTLWNVHRHRMAPEIAQQLKDDKKLQVLDRRQYTKSKVKPTLAINCTGSELSVERSSMPLLRNLLAQRFIEPHGSGYGIAADAHYRAWGECYPNLFSIGALLTGQLLESTAVPELRVQAAHIADVLCK